MPVKKSAKAKGAKPASRPAPRADKAEGDAPVRAYIAALPAWQRKVAQRFDDIVQREVPNVKRAVKWGMPFYGVEGQGWFASFGGFAKHVKLQFFRGTELKPPPPNGSGKGMRAQDYRMSDPFDEAQVASWVRQASKLPGWGA